MKNLNVKSISSIVFFLLLLNTILPAQDWKEIAKQIHSDPDNEDYYGYSVAISGEYAIVGIYGDDSFSATNRGSAYILYKDQNGTNNWNYLERLRASDGEENDCFGASVSISGDYAIASSQNGRAYIFYKDQDSINSWDQVARLAPLDSSSGGTLNPHVSISGDYAAVIGDQSVYLFYKDQGGSNKWGQIKKIAAPSDAGDWGTSMSLSGENLLIGCPSACYDEYGNNYIGAAGCAYLYSKDFSGNNMWGLVKKLVASDRSQNDHFGCSVSINGDYAIIGANQEDDDQEGLNYLTNAGSAYIFRKDQDGPNTWGQVSKIIANDRTSSDQFGSSICINGDYAIVGTQINSNYGKAYIFRKDHGGLNNWGEVSRLVASDMTYQDQFGRSVSISGDYAIIGAPWKTNNQGAAYVFQNCQAPNIQFDNIRGTMFDISWEYGNGYARAVFVKEGSFEVADPDDSVTYTANAIFGQGDQIESSGWFCVYNGVGTSVTITGLTGNTVYYVKVLEYYGTADFEEYITGTATGNPASQTTASDFSEVGIDVANNLITGTNTSYQYSLNSTDGTDGDWTDCTVDNTEVSFLQGKVYIREKLLIDNFKLLATIAASAAAPSYSIDFVNETTVESVSSTVEYNTDNNFSTPNNSGPDGVVQVTPGTTLYFRFKATASTLPSQVQTLPIPSRPAVTNYTIDYVAETTKEKVIPADEYSVNLNMNESIQGTDQRVVLTPDQDMYFRKKATATTFSGEIQQLAIPPRPAAVSYAIDFVNETTFQDVSVTDEYSRDDPDMLSPIAGLGTKISVTPGEDIFFRSKGTISQFSGQIFQLIVPGRQPAPVVSLSDYNSSAAIFKKSVDGTGDNVTAADGYEYTLDNGTTWTPIFEGSTVDASGSKNIFVRKKAVASISFHSELSGNVDYELPWVTIKSDSVCNGSVDKVIVRTNVDNGKVYLVQKGVPQSTVTELSDAVSNLKGAVTDITAPYTDLEIQSTNLLAGTYFAYAVNISLEFKANSYNNYDSVKIYSNPEIDLGEDRVVCPGTVITLDPGAGFSQYEWSVAGHTDQTLNISDEGI